MIKIRVPATSANIGVGFDCLGIALNMYTYFDFERNDNLIIEGCDDRFKNKDNLVFSSFLKGLDYLNKEHFNVKIVIDSHVPVARGLGSSSTCVVAGVVASFILTETKLDLNEVLNICNAIEGHPDNVAPAIFGGLHSATSFDNVVKTIIHDVDPRFNFLVLIPNFETETNASREALPKMIPFKDAVSNISKLPFVLDCFKNYDVKYLKDCLNDKIHEPYRYPLIHESEDVKKICEIDSLGFFISGSGSTLINLIEDVNNIEIIKEKLSYLKHEWEVFLLSVDKEGVVVKEHC